jgi:hypothetical protein
MIKQRSTLHRVRIRFRVKLLNDFPVLMIATNHHRSINFRILKMCIIESTGITNGRRTAELIKETVLIGPETNYLIKGLSAHGGVLG